MIIWTNFLKVKLYGAQLHWLGKTRLIICYHNIIHFFYRIYYIEESEYPPHQKFIEKFTVKSIPEIFKLTEQRDMAVMLEFMQSDTMSYQPYIDRESSENYMKMKEPLYWVATIIMTSKTWPYMEQLNRIILMQQESGIRYYWERGVNIFQ